MHIRVVVRCASDFPDRHFEVPARLFRAKTEANLTRGIRWNSGVGIFNHGKEFFCHVAELGDEWDVEPETFALTGGVSTRLQCVIQKLEVRLLKEGFGGTDRIRRVCDDDIIGRLVFRKKLHSVAHENRDLWRA